MEVVRDQGRIHTDQGSRRRPDGAPSIDAIYERSRAHVAERDPEVEPRRMSMPVQNGTSRRHSEVNDGRRRSVAHSNQVHPMNESSRENNSILPPVPPDIRVQRHTREYRDREPRERGPRDREPRDRVHRNRDSRSREHRDRDSRSREFSRPIRSGTTRSTVDEYEDGEDDRYVVPALPMPIAILCCILNFLVPGFGSMVAAFCVLCCARTEGMTCREKCGSCCTVFGIGVLQLLLVACFLIGWIWSCIWGITFIGMSATFYEEDDDEYGSYPATPVRRRRQPTGNTPLPTPEVVVDQPYPGVRYPTEDTRHRRNRSRSRRTLSRISLTPSNFIYPMRAPSSMVYNSPPPPYRERATPPPPYWRGNQQGGDRAAAAASREERGTSRDAEGNATNTTDNSRPRNLATDTIYEEHSRR